MFNNFIKYHNYAQIFLKLEYKIKIVKMEWITK